MKQLQSIQEKTSDMIKHTFGNLRSSEGAFDLLQ